MNNKKFAGQVTALIALNLLVKFVWIFFIERKVQLMVGFEDFGIYYGIFNFALILSVINDPGLNNYLIQYLSKGENDSLVVSQLFFLKTVLSGFYVVVSLLVSLLLGFTDYQLLSLILVYQILFSFLNYCRGFLKAHQFLSTEIYFSVLEKSILIVGLVPILYFESGFAFTIVFFVGGQIVAVLLSLILCVFYLGRKEISVAGNLDSSSIFLWKTERITTSLPQEYLWDNRRRRGTLEQLNCIRTIFRKIAPFALFAFLVLAYNKIDAVMLSTMLPNGGLQTGIYVAAYRFLDAASMMPILFATLFYPVLCKIIADRNKIETLVDNSLSTLLSLTLIVALTSWFYRSFFMELFYNEKTSEQLSLIFGLLMFCLPLVVLYYVLSSFFTANNNLKLLNYVSLGGLLVNVCINFFLIPNYQALGATIGSVISFGLVGFAYLVVYYRYFKFSFQIFLWVKLFMFIGILVIIGCFFNNLTNYPILNCAIYLMFSVGFAFAFRFFDLKRLQSIIRQTA